MSVEEEIEDAGDIALREVKWAYREAWQWLASIHGEASVDPTAAATFALAVITRQSAIIDEQLKRKALRQKQEQER